MNTYEEDDDMRTPGGTQGNKHDDQDTIKEPNRSASQGNQGGQGNTAGSKTGTQTGAGKTGAANKPDQETIQRTAPPKR